MFIPLAVAKKKKTNEMPVSQRVKKTTFRGAFFCTGGVGSEGFDVTLERGFVNGLEPQETGVNISGDIHGANQPHITGSEEYDQYDRAYVCIKIGVDTNTGAMLAATDGVTDENLGIEIRQNFHTTDHSLLYQPVAIIHKQLGVIQVAYHDFLHISINQNGILRHLMFAS